ncbi:hypothetical protein C8J57DRAFT_1211944 [Mycena rebaudengoi]|nr:hypothetical protein C8J57DRAFT_1211944 [Mycena rebaudengoi]
MYRLDAWLPYLRRLRLTKIKRWQRTCWPGEQRCCGPVSFITETEQKLEEKYLENAWVFLVPLVAQLQVAFPQPVQRGRKKTIVVGNTSAQTLLASTIESSPPLGARGAKGLEPLEKVESLSSYWEQ